MPCTRCGNAMTPTPKAGRENFWFCGQCFAWQCPVCLEMGHTRYYHSRSVGWTGKTDTGKGGTT